MSQSNFCEFRLWDIPVKGGEPTLEYYRAEEKKSRGTVLIFPGGAYSFRAEHEGKGYALFLNALGYDAFVCQYRVAPQGTYPAPLCDAARAIRMIRHRAEEWGIDPGKIAVMGSSAGGNLAALLSTCKEAPCENETPDEVDIEDFRPNFQILCYPVISLCDDTITHSGSKKNLCGGQPGLAELLSPEKNVTASTPPAFLWHTDDDDCVPVENTLLYAGALRAAGVSAETHIFPHGHHGLGLALGDETVKIWTKLLERRLLEWMK